MSESRAERNTAVNEENWLREWLEATGEDPAAIAEALEAHRKGVSALLRWEAGDFGLEC